MEETISRTFRVGCDLSYNVLDVSTFIMNLSVSNRSFQNIVEETFTLEPNLRVEDYTQNEQRNRFKRFRVESGTLTLSYDARVQVHYLRQDQVQSSVNTPDKLPADKLPHLTPSRYCQSDELNRMAISKFGSRERGLDQVEGICQWINRNIEYRGHTTSTSTTALDTATQRVGVCRDFAHLGLALCRALNLPARFVTGYSPDLNPQDFHAVFEVWLGDRWYLFDPTERIDLTRFIRIGTGRDAADVPFANILGNAQMTELTIRSSVEEFSTNQNPPDESQSVIDRYEEE